VRIPSRFPVLFLLFVAFLSACGTDPGEDRAADSEALEASGLPSGAQAMSLLGEPLFPPPVPGETRQRQEAQLEEALAALEADPESPEALIWVGRRHAYLGEYRQAIATFTRGVELYPGDARFYRHRGHRYITVREMDRAIDDFRRAAELIQGTQDEVEPDGQPNALGIPTSTLHFNVWYHYGLAHYLKGEFDEAADKYRRCMEVSVHPDSKVATGHWLYMSLRRLGREEEARQVLAGLDLDALAPEIIESGSYLDLLRLYASGQEEEPLPDPSSLDGATKGYGVGNWMLYNGHREEAREVFRRIVDAGDQWAAFGYIASEADLARMPEG